MMPTRIKPISFPEPHKRSETGNLELLIAEHIDIRLEHMAKSALFLSKVFRANGIVVTEVGKSGATLQFGRGLRIEHTEAAHNLPCDVLVNGVSFWKHLGATGLKIDPLLRATIERNFASTLVLPKFVNYVDTSWERGGLIDDYTAYLTRAVVIPVGPQFLDKLISHAKEFFNLCLRSFMRVSAEIRSGEPFRRSPDEIGLALDLYLEKIRKYDPSLTLRGLAVMLG